MKKHGAYSRPGSIPPWEHNRIVAKRKKYRRVGRQFVIASREPLNSAARSFRQLGESALRAADHLRRWGKAS